MRRGRRDRTVVFTPTQEKTMATETARTTVVNLTAGHEDADRVTVAFLIAGAALAKGRRVAMFLTKEAVRLALPGYADAVESAGAAASRAAVRAVRRGRRRAVRLPDLLQRAAP